LPELTDKPSYPYGHYTVQTLAVEFEAGEERTCGTETTFATVENMCTSNPQSMPAVKKNQMEILVNYNYILALFDTVSLL
jgi:hypothetical protein